MLKYRLLFYQRGKAFTKCLVDKIPVCLRYTRCVKFFLLEYLHSSQKAASLLMQHLKNPPALWQFLANVSCFLISQSKAQVLASREEPRWWHPWYPVGSILSSRYLTGSRRYCLLKNLNIFQKYSYSEVRGSLDIIVCQSSTQLSLT